MKVSIITPTLNIDEFLNNSIDCVRKQNYKDFIEHIIIIDSEISNLPVSIKRKGYNLIFFSNQGNKGPSNARNLGLDKCTGEVIFFLDSDDLWPYDYLSKIMDIYKSNSNIFSISTIGYQFTNLNKLFKIKYSNSLISEGYINSSKIAWNAIGCPSGFSYRSTDEIKDLRFFSSARYFEDYLFYLNLHFKYDKNIYRTTQTNYWYRKSICQATYKPILYNVEDSKNAILNILYKVEALQKSKYLTITNIQLNRLTRKFANKNVLFITLLLCLYAPSYFISIFGKFIFQIKNTLILKN